jgi:hypothetical protein
MDATKKQQWQQPVAAMQLFFAFTFYHYYHLLFNFCVLSLSLSLSLTHSLTLSLSLTHSFKFFGNFCRWEWLNALMVKREEWVSRFFLAIAVSRCRIQKVEEDKNSRMLKSYFLLNIFFHHHHHVMIVRCLSKTNKCFDR